MAADTKYKSLVKALQYRTKTLGLSFDYLAEIHPNISEAWIGRIASIISDNSLRSSSYGVVAREKQAVNLALKEIKRTSSLKGWEEFGKSLIPRGEKDEAVSESAEIGTAAAAEEKTQSPKGNVAGKNPYEVLHIKPGATDEEIRDAYRKEMVQNHPDMLGPNATKEQIEEATEKSKIINQAFLSIKMRAKSAAAQPGASSRVPTTPGLPSYAGGNDVLITLAPSEDIKPTKIGKSTSTFLENINNAGLVLFDEEEIAGLKATGKIPQNATGENLSTALLLYSRGASSVDLIDKTFNSPLSDSQKQQLFATGFVLSALEDEHPKITNDMQSNNSYPTISIDALPPSAQRHISTPNQIFLKMNANNQLTPVFKETAGRGVDILKGHAQQQIKKAMYKALEKGTQKVAKEITKKLAEKGLTATADAVLTSLGIATSEVGVGIIILAAELAIKIAGAALKIFKKISSKLLEAITGEKDFKKQVRDVILAGGAIALVVGQPILLFPLGAVGIATGAISVPGIVFGALGVMSSILKLMFVTFLSYIFAALAIVLVSFIFTFVVIQMGAYMSSPGGFGVETEMGVRGRNIQPPPNWFGPNLPPGFPNPPRGVPVPGPSNPYMTADKSVSKSQFGNGDPTTNVTYTIRICAGRSGLQLMEMGCVNSLYGEGNAGAVPPAGDPNVRNRFIPQGECITVTYTSSINPGALNDSALLDRCCILANGDGNNIGACTTAAISIGEPPFCFEPKGFENHPSELANLQAALLNLASSDPALMAAICSSCNMGQLGICYDNNGVIDAGLYGWHAHQSSGGQSTCDVYLNSLGLSTPEQATWIVGHELTHHLEKCDPSSYSCFSNYPGLRSEGPVCTYDGIGKAGDYEDFAETVGRFFSGWTGDQSGGGNCLCNHGAKDCTFAGAYPVHAAALKACLGIQ